MDTQRRYLVANKIDLVEQRRIDEETGRRVRNDAIELKKFFNDFLLVFFFQFALRNSLIYFETSCKTGENILDLFEQIASDLVRQHHPKLVRRNSSIDRHFSFLF